MLETLTLIFWLVHIQFGGGFHPHLSEFICVVHSESMSVAEQKMQKIRIDFLWHDFPHQLKATDVFTCKINALKCHNSNPIHYYPHFPIKYYYQFVFRA